MAFNKSFSKPRFDYRPWGQRLLDGIRNFFQDTVETDNTSSENSAPVVEQPAAFQHDAQPAAEGVTYGTHKNYPGHPSGTSARPLEDAAAASKTTVAPPARPLGRQFQYTRAERLENFRARGCEIMGGISDKWIGALYVVVAAVAGLMMIPGNSSSTATTNIKIPAIAQAPSGGIKNNVLLNTAATIATAVTSVAGNQDHTTVVFTGDTMTIQYPAVINSANMARVSQAFRDKISTEFQSNAPLSVRKAHILAMMKDPLKKGIVASIEKSFGITATVTAVTEKPAGDTASPLSLNRRRAADATSMATRADVKAAVSNVAADILPNARGNNRGKLSHSQAKRWKAQLGLRP